VIRSGQSEEEEEEEEEEEDEKKEETDVHTVPVTVVDDP